MLQIVLAGTIQCAVSDDPRGMVMVQFIDQQSNVVVVIPMSPEAARNLGLQLSSRLVVAAPGSTVLRP
jgi:hypothetical protein